MLLNLAIFTLGSVVCAIAPSIEWLLFGRFIQGIGVAACVFLPRTIVRDIYSSGKAASVIGYMTTAMMIAPMFGPAMGGWITDNYSWRFMYTGLAVLGCFLLMAAFFHQHETLASLQPGAKSDSENDKPGFLKASGVLIKDRRFQCVVLMQTGAVGVYYAFLSGGPYVAIESRGMSASSCDRESGNVCLVLRRMVFYGRCWIYFRQFRCRATFRKTRCRANDSVKPCTLPCWR